MTSEASFRITPRLIIGFGILALGMLWTLENLDVLQSEPITRWWPVLLVIIGLGQVVDGRPNKAGPIVLILIGVLMLLDVANLIDLDLGDLIPLAIALFGAKLIWEAVTRRHGRRTVAADGDSVIHAFAMMAGVKRQSVSREFRGGDANAVMGGVELDLRNAQVAPGEDVLIDAFAMWGGIEMQVPPNWRIAGNVLPIMGAFEDNTHHNGEPGPLVTIRGTAIMGAIEVKN